MVISTVVLQQNAYATILARSLLKEEIILNSLRQNIHKKWGQKVCHSMSFRPFISDDLRKCADDEIWNGRLLF